MVFALLLCGSCSAAVLFESPSAVQAADTQGAVRDAATPERGPLSYEEQTLAEELEAIEAEETARAEWLESPAAIHQRHESRSAFDDLTTSEASDLLASTFREALNRLDGDPARILSDLQIEEVVGEHGALIPDGEGGSQLVESPIPIRSQVAGEGEKPLDLTLTESGSAFVPRTPATHIRLPDSLGGEVPLGESLAISSLPGDTDVSATRFGDKDLFFANAATDTDTFIAPLTGGVEIFEQLRSPQSPEQFRFGLTVPKGATLRVDERGGAEIVDSSGERAAFVPAPYAVDAQGTDVPVSMDVDGNDLVVSISHRSLDFAYPLLLDPELVIENWYWNGGSTFGLGYWGWQETADYDARNDGGCIVSCWGSGLYLRSKGNNFQYNANTYGRWVYSAPNSTAYISRAVFSTLRGNINCTPSNNQPHGWVGLWNGGSYSGLGVYSPLSFSAPSFNTGSVGGTSTRWVHVGIGTAAQSIKRPCGHDFYVGGATIYQDDPENPGLSMSGIPSGWITDSPSFTITATGTDPGLGVREITFSRDGQPTVKRPAGCNGTAPSRCLTSRVEKFSQTGASFDEGKQNASITVEDATGRKSTQTWQTYVDLTKPDLTLSGQLAVATDEVGGDGEDTTGADELSLPVYNLEIKATDVGTQGDADDRKRSGVRKIEVKLDGVKKKEWEQSCTDSCSMEQAYTLGLSDLSADKHTLTVIATDYVGKARERNIEFEYVPATGIKDEYVMHRFPLPDGTGNEDEEEYPARPELAVNVMNGNLVYRERDIEVEGYGVDLEVERYYNSMLPDEEDTEWGDGWTLSQQPRLEPEEAEGAPKAAMAVTSSAAVQKSVTLPTSTGGEEFDPKLHAVVSKVAGGYTVKDETGESGAPTTVFDQSGKVTELRTEGSATVDYSYDEGVLDEIKVVDPATFSADPAELAIPEPGPLAHAATIGHSGTGKGQFSHPADAAVDSTGEVWVADSANNRIQHFDTDGDYLEQFGTYGTSSGKLDRPAALAIDEDGDIVVADANNDRIQRFDSEGIYLSKFGSYGSANGQFKAPEGLAIGPEGEIWVADTYNDRVQKFTTAGAFVKAIGTSGPGELTEPRGIDVAPNGDVFVADFGNDRVVVFSEKGEYLDSFATEGSPDGLDVDAEGDVWVADEHNEWVERFDAEGAHLERFGSEGTGVDEFEFSEPMGIAADEQGRIWITDSGNDRLQRWEAPVPAPTHFLTFGSQGTEPGLLDHPADIDVDAAGDLWVADAHNDRIQRFDPDGAYKSHFGLSGSSSGKLDRPAALAIDEDGDIVVADANNDRIQRFDSEGIYLSKFGSYGSANGQFNGPEGIAIGPEGEIWVADTYNDRVQKFTTAGAFVKAIGTSGPGELTEPRGIDVAPNGDVFVADFGNDRVVVFSEKGEYLNAFDTDGNPDGLDVNAEGSSVWVADENNEWVERFDLQGIHIGRFGGEGTDEDEFEFSDPMGLVADEEGGVWVADSGNDRLQGWRLPGAPIAVQDGDPEVVIEHEEGLVSNVEGEEAGEHSYEHEGALLTAYEGPEGETSYEYDEAGRLTRIDLPNGTWAEIEYQAHGRVESVTVDPAGSDPEKTTEFSFSDQPRKTVVDLPDAPAITYEIGNDGSVFKWQNALEPPEFEVLAGTLYDVENRETADAIEVGEYNLVVHSYSEEGIASVQVYANGDQLISEKSCEKGPESDCKKVPDEWVTYTGNHAPGILNIEIVIEDHIEQVASKRFWVNVPYTPPPSPDEPEEPTFADVLEFREEHGLDLDLDPVKDESEINDRVFDTINDWVKGEPVAIASMERWGAPLRARDVAELEYREWYMPHDLSKVDQWARANFASTYAGLYVDERNGGLMRVGFTSGQAGAVSAIKTGEKLLAAHRIALFAQAPSHSLGTLEELENQVHSSAYSLPEGLIISIGVDVQANDVTVGATNVSEAASHFESTIGQQAPISVTYEEGLEEAAARKKISGRILAGDFLRTPEAGTCSAGFGAVQKLKNGKKVNFLLTAAHCAKITHVMLGHTILRENSSGDSAAIGVVQRSGWSLDLTNHSTDGAAIKLTGTLGPARWINSGKGSLVAVKAVDVMPPVGKYLCHSGWRSNAVLCGRVHKVKYFYDGIVKNRRLALYCFEARIRKGDSGGPVWIQGSNIAVGLATNGRGSLGNETYKETCAAALLPKGIPSDAAILSNTKMTPIRLAYAP